MTTILPPSKLERSLRSASYLLTSTVGLYVILAPPATVTTMLGHTTSLLWALFMLSGIPGAVFTLAGKYKPEYVCLSMFTSALLVATVSGWLKAGIVLATWGVTAADPAIIPRTAIATALVLVYGARWLTLHRLTAKLNE